MGLIVNRIQRLDEITQSFQRTTFHMVERFRNQVSVLSSRLESASPENIMGRGYAYVSSPLTGENIKSYSQVAVGDKVDVRLHKGGFAAGVTKVKGEN